MESFDIVAVCGNKVECCFDKVERSFDNVACFFDIVAGVDGVINPIVRRSAGAAMANDTLKKNRLNWKLKISNTADNADITQSQARDTRHRRIQ